jgi:glycosyltransferase involved in cell wall biosynthesis
MKKKILFTAYDLNVGGIEKALVNLLNYLDKDKYDITLILEHKEGPFLKEIPSDIKVEEYKVSNDKNVIKRKLSNRTKLINWIAKNKNKYDFAISFATYSTPGAFLALNGSKRNAIWIHSDYYSLYDHNVKRMDNFFKIIKISKFKSVIFVDETCMENILNNTKIKIKNPKIINNIVDYKTILKKSKNNISLKRENKVTFLNVGRMDDKSKKLYRIFDAALRLKNENYDFKIIILGNGPDYKKYNDYVKNKNLKKYIKFYGQKINPYPFFLISDAVLLCSKYEGYPNVFHEAMVLNKPIITTQVTGTKDILGKYGIVVENNDSAIYNGMKKFIDYGYVIKNKFDCNKYNCDQLKKIIDLIN